MIVTIQEVTDEFTKSGAPYKKVKGVTGDGRETTKSVFDNLEEKWELLKEGATLQFHVEKKGQFWKVTDIEPVTAPPPTEPGKPLPEQQAEVDKALAHVRQPQGVEIGKCENQVIQLFCAGKLSAMFGEKIAIELTRYVRGTILSTLKVDYEGKDLPQFKPREKG
uniref:Uncharacterized protein n=1 Tax=viral metagenome TaxID=1070528 RepID=A0A6M3LYL4_9ZZZZ